MFTSDKGKLLAAGLALTMFGGAVGAFTTRSNTPTTPAPAPTQTVTAPAAQPQPLPQPVDPMQPQIIMPDQLQPGMTYQLVPVQGTQVAPVQYVEEPQPVTRRSTTRTRRVSSSSPQRTYYTYSEAPQKKPSFWNRHRDILTVGIGTGVGAAIGGLAGGKKGAAIGALAGGGGSALYTYGLRKRN
ncbi:MAG: hypothetical protein HY774_11385 [Acidobacteria bacterium]|nr:hypothetical protein [Acidobacteriota bacterium]